MLKIIGNNLKNKRIEVGLNQEGLSILSGVAQQTISKIEKGHRNITILTLEKLAKALNVNMKELVQ
jgi:transcriptional regulator with XRE-family HTH domain